MTFNKQGNTFYASFVPWYIVKNISPEPLIFSPPVIHTQKHVGPVLGFRATRAGMNCQQRIILIMLTGKHAFQFKIADPRLKRRKGFSHLSE